MKSAPFSYICADSVAEALAALARYRGDCRIIAGGQSLGAMLNMRLVTPKVILDINRLDDLNRIVPHGQTVSIGATVRQADAVREPAARRASLMRRALPFVGHYQTRNRGTVCGSIAHADPSAELPLALLVAGGLVELRSQKRARTVVAADFFLSTLTTARQPDEMVVAVHWPLPTQRSGCAFSEFAIRSGDYAIVAAAAEAVLGGDGKIERLRLGFGGVGECPLLIATREFEGQMGSLDLIEALADSAARSVDPIDDLQASAAYRRHLVRVLGRQVVREAIESARNGAEAKESIDA